MEVLFAGLKNNNYQGKTKKKTQKNTKTRTAGSAAQGRQGPRLGSGCTAALPERRPGGKLPKLRRFAPFSSRRVFFCPAVKHPAGQRSPVPSAPRSTSLPAFPKIGFIPRIYSTKHPQPPRRGFSSVPTKPCAGRGGIFLSVRSDFCPHSLIFFHHSFFFPPIPLFFFQTKARRSKKKKKNPKGKHAKKLQAYISIIIFFCL